MPQPKKNHFTEKIKSGFENEKHFKYVDENDFVKKLRSLRTYCPRSYKQLIFRKDKRDFYSMKNGRYQKKLYTSAEFEFVYGEISLVYSVKDGDVVIEDLLPSEFLLDGYFNLLDTYKGVPYRNKKDIFKIDLFINLKKKELCL